MSAHVVAITKMVDDLRLYLVNQKFNADSNLTLTQERAVDRFSYIRGGSIHYIYHIGFVGLDKSRSFTGLADITFELTSIPKQLPLDFVCSEFDDLIVNGYSVTPQVRGEFVMIPRIYLQLGVNNIAIRYIADFSNDGYGCLSYIDTTASPPQYYTYTHF